ncbi:MAG: efflux transporter outer membrane subunit [Burkholderiales bacterium]|nr:efflux transporter outer membrane subunit [Burkholderiales bacterium]
MKNICLSSAALMLAACSAVGPDYRPPQPQLPAAYSMAAGTAALAAAWWESFGDAGLDALIAQAFAASPDLAMAQARVRQARAQQGIQDAAGGPALQAGARLTRDRLSEHSEALANIPFKNVQTEFSNHQLGFDASWEPDWFGRRQRLSEAAAARSDASILRWQDARLMLAAEVARNYLELRLSQQRLALATANLGNFEESLRLARLAARAGAASALEVAQAEAERDNYAAGLAALALSQNLSLAALSRLTARTVQELSLQLQPAAPLMAVPPAPAAGLPSDLLRRRPDLAAAEQDLMAANADIGVAVAELYPRFALLGTAGWSSIAAGNLLESASTTWSFGPQLSLPLFNRGRLQHQVQASQAAFELALAAYRKAILAASADVEAALTRVARSEARRTQLLQAEAQQARLLALTERQMRVGELPKTALLNAAKNLAAQQDQRLQAQAQSLSAIIALCQALGGGWSE